MSASYRSLARDRRSIFWILSPLLLFILLPLLLLTPRNAFGQQRARLGVSVQTLTPELRESMDLPSVMGALVSEVDPGGPADRAGIRERDVIVRVDGERVDNARDLVDRLADHQPGDALELGVLRDGRDETYRVTLEEAGGDSGEAAPRGDRDDRMREPRRFRFETPGEPVPPSELNDPAARDPERREERLRRFLQGAPGMAVAGPTLGVQVHEIDAFLAPYFKTQPASGLLVLDVEPGTAAERAGIRPGDVLLRFQGSPVTQVEELRRQVRSVGVGQEWTASLLRNGERLEVRGEMPEQKTGGMLEPPSWLSQRGQAPGAGALQLWQQRARDRLDERLEELNRRLQELERKIDRLTVR
ncbi:MAG: PDZ domain-containing protein [Candidatus Eisenbacteria bacterium]